MLAKSQTTKKGFNSESRGESDPGNVTCVAALYANYFFSRGGVFYA